MYSRMALLFILMTGLMGCPSRSNKPPVKGADCIWPAEAIIQNSFSRIVKNEGGSQSTEELKLLVYVQIRDAFGDSIKALGQFRFELYRYKSGINNDVRNAQRYESEGVQLFDLSAVSANQALWDRTTQCYRFELKCPKDPGVAQGLVTQVTFDNGRIRLNQVQVINR